MSLLVVTAALALSAPAQEGGKAQLDGKWLIVYAEEGGRRNNAWEQRQATAADGAISYETEGGKRSFKLKLGPNQTLEATLAEGEGADKGKTWRGVYVLSQDYLCLSLNKGDAPAAGAGHGSSADFILILRRQRGAAPPP